MNEEEKPNIPANVALWLGVFLILLGIAKHFGYMTTLFERFQFPHHETVMVVVGIILTVIASKLYAQGGDET